MTPQEWIDRYGSLGRKVQDKRVLFLSTTATMGIMAERIWGKGGLTEGGTLSYKEDYEVYGYKPPLPKKPSGKGKPYALWTPQTRAPKKGTANKIKGGWAPTYLALKAQQGRADLPFEMTGDMRLAWGGGAKVEPSEVTPLLCRITMPDKEFKKAEGLADRKGTFLGLTTFELKEHVVNITRTYREVVLGQ